jgi:ketosteroid isomerase-like protein
LLSARDLMIIACARWGAPMKQWVLIPVIVLACLGTPAFAQSTSDEIEQVIKAFLIPFSNQDVAGFIDYFADDAVVFFPSARFAPMRVEGKANVARTFAAVFKPGQAAPPTGAPLIQPQDLRIQRFGDSAVVTFHLGTDTARGRRTFVLHRLNSQWRIVHLHASSIVSQ